MSALQNDPIKTSSNPSPSGIVLPDYVIGEVNDINSLLSQMDQVFNETAKTRVRLQTKLESTLDTFEINPMGDPEQLDAQMNLLDKIDKVAASREKSFVTRIATRLKHRETEENSKLLGAMSAKILKEFTPTGETAYVPSANEELSTEAITEVERKLAMMDQLSYNEGELKKDPSDVS